MKKIIVGLVLLLYSWLIFANRGNDTVVFVGPTEQKYISDFLNDTTSEILFAYLAVNFNGPQSQIESDYQRVERNLSAFVDTKFEKQPPAKKVKTLYKQVHDLYLSKYELLAGFRDMLHSGEYNCLTAVTLFSVYFDRLGIDYQIKASQQHAYLIAYPETEAIRVETTNPQNGTFQPNDKFKEQYIKYLHDSKQISDDEYSRTTANELFSRYYYAETNISTVQLVGLLYYNEGVKYLQNEDFKQAFYSFEKSGYFYAPRYLAFLKALCLEQLMSRSNFSSIEELFFVLKYDELLKGFSSQRNTLGVFNNLTIEYLINQKNTAYYEQVYQYIQQHCSDSVTLLETAYMYNYEKGRYFYNTGYVDKALASFGAALKLKPNNVDAQASFNGVLNSRIDKLSLIEQIDEINKAEIEYPQLSGNLGFSNLQAHVFLLASLQYVSLNEIGAARQYLNRFEELFKMNNIDCNKNLIGEVYTSFAVYYYKIGRYADARQAVSRGLELAPGNFRLMQAKQSIMR